MKPSLKNMDDDILKKILGEEKETPAAPKEPPKKEEEKKPEQTPEEIEKTEHLTNLNKAIEEGNEELRRIRAEKKKEKPSDEDVPKINFDDPSAKAWDNHIKESVNPMQAELEKEKSEIRQFALRDFLADKPALAKNPEKVKELVGTYEKLRTASERTKEGVLLDLDKAYAAVFHEELLNAARSARSDNARKDAILSDIAVSHGATAYSPPFEKSPQYTEDDRQVLARWGMTPEAHAELVKDQRKKA